MNGDGSTENFAIDLHHVTKIYPRGVLALQGIDMRVRAGEVFGLLGPNGAGKSTLVKIMMTVVHPTRVDGTILGRRVGHKPTLARVGYLPENHRFPRYLTGRQTLEFLGALAKVDRPTRRRRSGELLSALGMSDWADHRISTYSKGMMQRIGLAQAMMNDPDLLVLDEPTDGVDPVGRRDIRDVLARLRDQGKTVFLNSHLLSELEMVCDRVAILVKGRVARQGTLDELSVARQRYEIEVAADEAMTKRSQLMTAVPARWKSQQAVPAGHPVDRGTLADGQWVELEGAVFRVGTTEAADVQPILDSLRSGGFTVRRVQSVRPSLEDLFLEAVTEQAAGGAALPVAPSPPPVPMPAGAA